MDDLVTERKLVCGPPGVVFGVLAACFGVAFVAAREVTAGGIAGCVILCTAGIVLSTLRTGTIISMRSELVYTWWGLLVPMVKTRTMRLSVFDRVLLKLEHHEGGEKSVSYTMYLIVLKGDRRKFRVAGYREQFHKARAMSEQVAKLLDLPIHELRDDKTVIRERATLDETLAERARRTGETVDVPPQPEDGKIVYTTEGRTAVFTIPPSGFRAMSYVLAGFGVIAIVGAVLGTLSMLSSSDKEAVKFIPVPITLGLLFAGWLIFTAVRFATRIEVLTISPEHVKLEYEGRLHRHRVKASIPSDRVEDLELCKSLQNESSGQVLAVRGDYDMIEFGSDLSPEEQEWLYSVMWNVLTSPQKRAR